MVKKRETTTGAENIHWDLTDLFTGYDDPKIETTLTEAQANALKFQEKYKGRLHTLQPSELEQAYGELIEIINLINLVGQFAGLKVAVNTAEEKAKALEARVQEVSSKLSNHLVFFHLELGALEDDIYKQFISAPELADFRYRLQRTHETAKYNLSEKEEQVLNLKALTGASAFNKLYGELTASFKFEFEIDGETRTYTGAEMRSLRQHPQKDVRRRAMKLFFDRYAEHGIVMTHVFNHILKDFNIDKELRGYSSAINVMNVGNDLNDRTVETLMEATTASNPLVQRYYKLKAKLLNLEDMTLADIYAPLPESSKAYTWEDAKGLVLEAFESFDGDFYRYAREMFEHRRVDAPVVPGKRGGAFCSYSTPQVKPYVFLNFTGKVRDVATLAHEFGHAIHGFLSGRQNLLNFHPILPLAETASVFSEMVLTDKFLKQETDKGVKKSLLTTKLEDIFSTSHRQNMFSRFELKVHSILSDRIISADEFCELYRGELELMFGDAVQYPQEYNWEWSSIPHMINVPFYVYAYNFANLLVLALYQQYLEEGRSFIPKFKEFLALGSSASPVEIAATVGQDIADPGFWQKGLNYIESLLVQLEDLTDRA
ncbi:MAG: M3 family oligoendopeptidase [FCB group bacterium]|nr:M3 family oligoendopeptidase [FCB group bacterium]